MNLNNSATVICMALSSVQAVNTNYYSRLMVIKPCRSPLEVSSLLGLRIQSHSHWDIIAQNLYQYLKFRMSYWLHTYPIMPCLLTHCGTAKAALLILIAWLLEQHRYFLQNRTGPVQTFGCKFTGKVLLEETITSLAHFLHTHKGRNKGKLAADCPSTTPCSFRHFSDDALTAVCPWKPFQNNIS